MRNPLRFRTAHKKGQSLVEFALVLPILVLIIMGIFDLGWAVYMNNTIANAAREGARVGVIITNQDAAIRARVRSASPGLNLSDSQISITPSPARTFNNPITVTVMITFSPITPIIGQFVAGSGMPLRSTSAMIVEGVTNY
jgi:Flp pilus assembly protein TadG